MMKLERLFSKDRSYLETKDSECDEPESSINQLPFNKAFLSLALVEPQRRISNSLNELDRCILNKVDLCYSANYDGHEKEESRKVNFVDSPNMYSLSTISELSDHTLSPLQYPLLRKGSLEVALETLSSTDSSIVNALLTDMDESPIFECDESVEYYNPKMSSTPNKNKTVSLNKTVEIVENVSPESCESYPLVDLCYEKKPDPLDCHEILKCTSTSYSPAPEMKLKDKDVYKEILPKVLESDECLKETKPVEALLMQQQHPKSILKKILDHNESGLMSEPINRRHTIIGTNQFSRDVKSVSHMDSNYLQQYSHLPPKRKKHSAPAKMQLTKLKSTLKANRKFLDSLQKTDNCSEELIELLVKQAELLNQDINRMLMYNALKYGGVAVVAILLTCASVGYCVKYKRSCHYNP